MKHFLLTVAGALSLAACLAALVLWPATRDRALAWRLSNEPGRARFLVLGGGAANLVTQEANVSGDGSSWTLDLSTYGNASAVATSDGSTLASVTMSPPLPPPGTGPGLRRFRANRGRVTFNTPDGRTAQFTLFLHARGVGFPLLALLTALPALALLWRHARHRAQSRRVARGLCAGCGYDLRAGHDRCPECGRHVPEPAGHGARSPAAPGAV